MTLVKFKGHLKFLIFAGAFLAYSMSLVVIGTRLGPITQKVEIKKINKEASILKKPLPEENIQSAKVLASHVKICANTVFSFELTYPKDWFTTYDTKDKECTLFAPYSFVAPQNPELEIVPITLKIIPKDEWETTVKSAQTPTELFNIIKSQNLQINERPANYLESSSTGGSTTKGFMKITYLIFDSERPVEISYSQQTQLENINDYKKVLEDMVNSLKLY